MELKILEETKKRAVIELDNQTIASMIEKELWNDSHVKAAGQKQKHPLIGKPTIFVETDEKEAPKEAFKEAVGRIKKDVDKFRKAFK